MRNKILQAMAWAEARKHDEEGQDIVEYALIIGVISLIVLAGLVTAIQGGVDAVAQDITDALT